MFVTAKKKNQKKKQEHKRHVLTLEDSQGGVGITLCNDHRIGLDILHS